VLALVIDHLIGDGISQHHLADQWIVVNVDVIEQTIDYLTRPAARLDSHDRPEAGRIQSFDPRPGGKT
jgi:hypothetical protein